MKIIKSAEAMKGANSAECKTVEYNFGDSDIDLGLATITGRYPEQGYGMNLKCKELIFVIEGNGTLHFEDQKIHLSKGDCVLIQPNEKYYWESDYCVVSMACTPAWSVEQYKLVD